jgi:hypothetical protein
MSVVRLALLPQGRRHLLVRSAIQLPTLVETRAPLTFIHFLDSKAPDVGERLEPVSNQSKDMSCLKAAVFERRERLPWRAGRSTRSESAASLLQQSMVFEARGAARVDRPAFVLSARRRRQLDGDAIKLK